MGKILAFLFSPFVINIKWHAGGKVSVQIWHSKGPMLRGARACEEDDGNLQICRRCRTHRGMPADKRR